MCVRVCLRVCVCVCGSSSSSSPIPAVLVPAGEQVRSGLSQADAGEVPRGAAHSHLRLASLQAVHLHLRTHTHKHTT